MKKILAMLISIVILSTFMVVPTFAEKSPEGDVFFEVEIKGEETVVVEKGETVILEVKPSGGSGSGGNVSGGGSGTTTPEEKPEDEFVAWKITGEYEIISGSLTSKYLVIRPLGDVIVERIYKSDLEEEDKEENESDKAPQTGNDVLMVTFLLTAVAFVTMIATKKSVKA